MVWLYDSLTTSDDDLQFYGEFSPEFYKHDLDFCDAIKQTPPEAISPIKLIVPDIQTGKIYDNLLVPPSFGILVNSKVRKVFDDCGVNNIDWYQTKIVRGNGKHVSDDYCLGNILTSIDTVDFDKSDLDIDEDDGSIRFIDKLILHDIENSPEIYRIGEFLSLVVVSDRLKSSLVEAGCTGIEFMKPESLIL